MKDNKNIEKTEDTENSRKKAAVMIFGREIPKKKAIIGTCALVIALVLIGGVCLTVALHSQKPEKANQSDININETVSEDKSESSQETSEESTAETDAPENSDAASDNPQASVSEKGGNSATSTNSHDGGNSGSNSGNSDSSKKDETPAHQHNWVPVTKTVHHDAEYKTVHHDAEYKTVHHDAVTKDVFISNYDGQEFNTEAEITAHDKKLLMQGITQNVSYRVETRVVQQAYDEQVLVKGAWDEQVLVKAAWDETVTTGYRCSTCGATK